MRMSVLDSLKRMMRAKTNISGVSILLLQKRFERFSTERLLLAMRRGWRQEYDPVQFFATDLEGEGAVLKVKSMFVTMQHFDRRADSQIFGNQVLPPWGEHSAYSSVAYFCPDGVAPGEQRNHFYGFLGLFCAEILSDNISALLFVDDQVLVRNNSSLQDSLRSGRNFDPVSFRSQQRNHS